jgi:hypothetical protein
MTHAPEFLPQPEEPENVKVARALGLPKIRHLPKFAGVLPHCEFGWCYIDKECLKVVPDFPNDPAFVVRMQTANSLCVCPSPMPDSHGVWIAFREWSYGNGDITGRGESPGRAVCSWLVAAAACGVEVRRG